MSRRKKNRNQNQRTKRPSLRLPDKKFRSKASRYSTRRFLSPGATVFQDQPFRAPSPSRVAWKTQKSWRDAIARWGLVEPSPRSPLLDQWKPFNAVSIGNEIKVASKRLSVCKNRQSRKEVLHAMKRVGRGHGGGSRRPKSEVSC